MAAKKNIYNEGADNRTEKASKEHRASKRTPTYDSLEDIPNLNLNKKSEETMEKKANEYTTFAPIEEDVSQKPISLADLNPINPAVFAAKDEDMQQPTLGNALFNQLDEALERTKNQVRELHEEIIEKAEEESFEIGIDPVDINSSDQTVYEEDNDDDNKSSDLNTLFEEEPEDLYNDENDEDDVDEEFIMSRNLNKKKKEDLEDQEEENKYDEYKNNSKNILDDLAEEDDDILNDNIDEEDDDIENEENNSIPDAPDLEDLPEEERQKVVDEIKNQIRNNITPVKKFDLDKFKIKKKPVSISTIMKITKAESNIADWVLPVAKRAISCSAISGTEIIKLDPRNSNRNRLNTYKDIYNIIYDHIVDNNKPEFEAWLKTTAYHDLEHYYFCIYKATFGKNNFMNRECQNPKCKHTFIADVDLNEMIKYSNDEAKELVKKIFEHDTTTGTHEVENDLVQISDTYAVSLSMPTIWSVIIETASLSEQFLEKYADMVDIYSFIDEIFFIDEENEELIPVDFKPVANDQTKTIANKIRVCYNVINSLSSDQYITLISYIRKMDSDNSTISYQIPECTCPKCGSKIEAVSATADELLFTRHQLGVIAAT